MEGIWYRIPHNFPTTTCKPTQTNSHIYWEHFASRCNNHLYIDMCAQYDARILQPNILLENHENLVASFNATWAIRCPNVYVINNIFACEVKKVFPRNQKKRDSYRNWIVSLYFCVITPGLVLEWVFFFVWNLVLLVSFVIFLLRIFYCCTVFFGGY